MGANAELPRPRPAPCVGHCANLVKNTWWWILRLKGCVYVFICFYMFLYVFIGFCFFFGPVLGWIWPVLAQRFIGGG